MASKEPTSFLQQLSDKDRNKVKKASSDRIRAELLKTGVSQADLNKLSREQLVECYAEAIYAGTAKVEEEGAPGAAAEAEGKYPKSGMDQDWGLQIRLEEMRIAADERRMQHEREMKQLDLQAQQQAEESQRHFEEGRLKAETEFRSLQYNEMLRKRELDNAPAQRAKLFGDAMRGTVAKMPQDAIDLLSYFNQVEQLFNEFKVDKELRVHLLKPHLTEMARNIIARMSPTDSTDFDKVKTLLLHEFKLSSATLLEKFNTLNRINQETYTIYANRLKSVLSHYVESRKAAKYDLLLELLVSDRIKANLSESALCYILSLESKVDGNWLHLAQLTSALDMFYDSHLANDKPRYVAPAVSSYGSKANTQPRVPPPRPPPPSNAKVFSRNVNHERRCYICGSKDHLQNFHNANKTAYNAQKSASVAPKKVNALIALNESVFADVAPVAPTGSEHVGVSPSPVRNVNESIAAAAAIVHTAQTASASGIASSNSVAPTPQRAACSTSETAMKAFVCDVIVTDRNVPPVNCIQTGPCDVYRVSNDYENNVMSVDEDFAKLQYIDVCVSDCDNNCITMSAMVDSGAEVCLANTSALSVLNLIKTGTVSLSGAIGGRVIADIVKLRIASADCPNESTEFKCAVTDGATHALILNTEVIARLQRCKATLIAAIVTDHEGDDDNDDGGDTENDNSTGDAHDDDASDRDATGSSNVQSMQPNSDSGHMEHSNANRSQQSDVQAIINGQRSDETLRGSSALAKKNKGNLYVRDDVLYRVDKLSGQKVEQLVLPIERRTQVLRIAHDFNHMSWKSTCKRLKASFWWPTIVADTKSYVMTCDNCTRRARVTVYDRVPIKNIERSEIPFNHLFCDACGPIGDTNKTGVYRYFFVTCDNLTRYPCAFALKKITAQTVCDCLLKVWSIFGVAQFISLDNAMVHRGKLMQLLLEKVGCSPIFITPRHSAGNSLAERTIGTIKEAIHRVACDHPKQWWRYIDFVLWAMREIPHSSLGVSSYELTFGRTMRGVGSILKDTWTGNNELPPDLNKPIVEYLCDLRERLATAHNYASTHLAKEQKRWTSRYNLRSRDKQFVDGNQ